MPFTKEILKYKSVSFVGMDKNAGKTETLNYVLSRLHSYDKKIAVTSIGIDGETVDQVTETSKPRVFLWPGTYFVTSEKLYDRKQIVSSVEDISRRGTSLGRLITAKAQTYGNVMLSGPTGTLWLREFIQRLDTVADICLVDGALSRKSFASPSVTQAMILSTGAVLSTSIDKIVEKTRFVCDMTRLDVVSDSLREKLNAIDTGVWAVDGNENIHDLEIPSMLMIDRYKDRLFSLGKTIFVSGMVNDKLLEILRSKKNPQDYTIITKDFTHIFSSPLLTNWFLKSGGRLLCLYKTDIIAVTANPVAPAGYRLDSERLVSALREHISLPVYDIKQI